MYLTNSGAPKVTLNWSPASEIIWTNGRKLLQCIDSRDNYYKSIEDVSVKMRERAKHNYGLDPNYLPDEPKLRSMWSWINAAKKVSETIYQEPEDSHFNKLVGIRNIIYDTSSPSSSSNHSDSNSNVIPKSDLNYAQWPDLPNNVKVPIYRSEERKMCLDLCGWGSNLDALLAVLMSRGDYTRAAAIALFNLQIRKAIDFLKEGANASAENGGDPHYSVIAMALSGYTGEKNSLWREMCSSLRYEIRKPYLKAIFSFLTAESELFEEILYDQSLELPDRVAFACFYLPDKDFKDYLEVYTTRVMENGSIDGLLLTGMSKEGLDLLQHYIEATSDVQTVSFVILHALPSPLCKDPRATLWVENYRNILDCWRLWDKRAMFDNEWYKRLNYRETPEPRLFVTCNFCGKSISPMHKFSSMDRSMKSSMEHHPHRKISVSSAPQDLRIQSCPNCRKPLPRCCICLTQFGSPSGSYWKKDESNPSSSPPSAATGEENTPKKKMSPMSTWFSWCQTCRHGGHAKHIVDWFNDNIECPVSGCACRCVLLDNDSKFQS